MSTTAIASHPKTKGPHALIRSCLGLVVLALALFVILPQIHGFRNSLSLLRSSRPSYVLVALFFGLITYGLAAATYRLLALRKINYGRTLIIQLANLLVNRIIPAGLGGLGLNYEFLRHNRHTSEQAITVVGLNNALGLIGHLILLAVLLVLRHNALFRQFHLPLWHWWWLIVAAILATILAAISRYHLQRRIGDFRRAVLKSLTLSARRPFKLMLALLSSMSLTVCTAASFWLCCLAVGIAVSFPSLFIVFSVGVLVGTATPTPGGLGGVEASLVAGLVAARVPAAIALAAVLLYRLLSYWLPLLFGGVALEIVRRRGYVTS